MKVNASFSCYGCGQPGHIKRNCPDLRKVIKNWRNEKYNASKVDNDLSESAKVVRLNSWYKNFFISESNNEQGWFVDSGATSHMCADRELFSDIDLS